jgi:hypothetical protein
VVQAAVAAAVLILKAQAVVVQVDCVQLLQQPAAVVHLKLH